MDIIRYQNRQDVLNETAAQIVKDFAMAGVEIKISEVNSPEELFALVLPLVEKLQSKNYQAFYNVMYRMDISKMQIRKAVEKDQDRSFSEIIADLILKRDLVKVITRKGFAP